MRSYLIVPLAALFGPFGLVVLDLRQQACVLRDQNHPNIASRNVLCSFFGAVFRSDKALAAENIQIFSRTITMYGRKSARIKPIRVRFPLD